MAKRERIPLLRMVQWKGKNRVALFFSSGRAVEVELPWVKSAKKAHIVDDGMGLDPGNGRDVDALRLVALPPMRVLLPGDRGWIGSSGSAGASPRQV